MSQKRPVSPFRVAFWCLLVGAVLLIAPFHRVVISGNSMSPTLKNGENYLADRWGMGKRRRMSKVRRTP